MKDCMVVRTYSTGLSGTNYLEECLGKGYSIAAVNSFGAGLEYVLEKDASENLYMKLVETYIKSTADVDGQLFCGCRKEDCTDYMCYSECRKCLEKHLKQEF